MVKPLYKDGKKRALTFSFDDGTGQDVRLIKIMNKYGIKSTFNLMGGSSRNRMFYVKDDSGCFWDGSDELRAAYAGHEIASHSYKHPHLPELSDEDCRKEIELDLQALEKAFGCKIRGYAAPYGDYDERVTALLKKNGVLYCRLVKAPEEKKFELPEDFYRWEPDGHFSAYAFDEGKQRIADFFACEKPLPCLYIWGHSYEINEITAAGYARWRGMTDRWSYVDELCKTLSGREDVWYATNIEICDYALCMRKARFDDTYIDNPTDIPLFFEVNGKVISAPPHTRFDV